MLTSACLLSRDCRRHKVAHYPRSPANVCHFFEASVHEYKRTGTGGLQASCTELPLADDGLAGLACMLQFHVSSASASVLRVHALVTCQTWPDRLVYPHNRIVELERCLIGLVNSNSW